MTGEKKAKLPMNAVRLCIDAYEQDIQGRIYSKLCSEPILFQNCGEMLLWTDDLFDRYGYPQAFQEKRSFRKETAKHRCYAIPRETVDDEMIWKQEGRYCTLDLIIRSRRQAGWQGRLSPPGKAPVNFQSEMELVENIRKVLADMKTSPSEDPEPAILDSDGYRV